MKSLKSILLIVGLYLVLTSGSGKPWTWPTIVGPEKPSLVVMLYEADHGPLPPYAMGASNELTAAGREVRMVDDDTLDGMGETPEWLKPALEPGRAIMGGTSGKDDALILLSGERVVKSLKLPATREAILEAVR